MGEKTQQTTIDEVHEIMFLLRGSDAKTDGDYRSKHLATVLDYLRKQKTENKQITLSKLALMIGMAQRQVKENYFDGLLNFGVIALNTECNRWTWIGVKAIINQFGQLRTNTVEDNEYVAESLMEHAQNNPNGITRRSEEKK